MEEDSLHRAHLPSHSSTSQREKRLEKPEGRASGVEQVALRVAGKDTRGSSLTVLAGRSKPAAALQLHSPRFSLSSSARCQKQPH